MCGRFALSPKTDNIEKLLPELYISVDIKPKYNISPTNKIVIIINDNKPILVEAQWGLIPYWAKDRKSATKMINVRAETLLEKPTFKNIFLTKRCLIPATGFFEWKKLNYEKSKIPYYIKIKDENIFTFGAIWNKWIDKTTGEEITSTAIITTRPNEKISLLHNRMPVIIEKRNREKWLNIKSSIDDLKNLLNPISSDIIEYWEISNLVNNPNNDFIEIIKPI